MAYGLRTVGGALAGAGKAAALGVGGAAAMGARQLASAVPGGAAAVTAGIGGLSMIGAGAMKGYQYAGGGGKGSGGKGSGGSGAGGVDDSFKSIIDTNNQLIAGQKGMFKTLVRIRLDTNIIRKCVEDMKALAYEDARSKLKEIKGPSKVGAAVTAGAGFLKEKGLGLGKILLMAAAFFGSLISGFLKKLKVIMAARWAQLIKFFSAEGWIARKFVSLVALVRDAKIWGMISTFFSKEGIIARTFTTLKADLLASAFWTNIKTFFTKEGWIAKQFVTLKADLLASAFWTNIKTFFTKEGWIAKQFVTLKADLLASSFWTNMKTFFTKEGWIAKQFVTLKADLLASSFWTNIKTFFTKEGWIAKQFATLKADLLISSFWTNIKTFFTKEGWIAKQFVTLKADLLASELWLSIKTFFTSEGFIAKQFTSLKTSIEATRGGLAAKVAGLFGAEGAIATRIGQITTTLRGVVGGAAGAAGQGARLVFQGARTAAGGIGSGVKAAFTTARTMVSGFFSTISTVFGHIKTIASSVGELIKGPLDVIKGLVVKGGGMATKFASIIGRVFVPIMWIIGIWEGITGFFTGWKEEAKEADADIMTKTWAGVMTGILDALNALIFLPVDLITKGVGWLLKKLGFGETGGKIMEWVDAGGFQGILTDIFQWIIDIPIKAWNFMKGLLGIGEAESEAGQKGATFVDDFKEKLGQALQFISDLIPDMSDIEAVAAQIFAKVNTWLGGKLIGVGEYIKTLTMPYNDTIGDAFINMGKDMQTKGAAVTAAYTTPTPPTDIVTNTGGQMAAAFVGATVANRGGRDAPGTVNVGTIDNSQKIIGAPTGVNTGVFGRIDVGATVRKSDAAYISDAFLVN